MRACPCSTSRTTTAPRSTSPTRRPRLGDVVTVRVRTSAADPVDAVWLRTTYDAEPIYHPMTAEHRRRHHLVGGRAAGAQPGDPLPLPARRTGRTGSATVAHRRRPRSTTTPRTRSTSRLSAYAAAPGLGPRRRRLPGLPRPLRALGGGRRAPDPGVGGRRPAGTTRSSSSARPAHPAPVLRRRPRRHHRAPRPRRARSAPTSSTRPRSSPARATTATTPRPSTRSTRCSAATRPTCGSRPPCTSAAGGSSAT